MRLRRANNNPFFVCNLVVIFHEEMGGAGPTTIRVRNDKEVRKVRWWGPTTDSAVRRTVRGALELEDDEHFELFDEATGAKFTQGEDGATYVVKWTPGEWNDYDDDVYQRDMVKYERVLSHLASERTILAWFRVSFVMLAQGLTLWDAPSRLLRMLGLLYFVIVPLTVGVSLDRWSRTKRSLEKPRRADFGQHIYVQSLLISVLCIVTSLTYFVVVGDIDDYVTDLDDEGSRRPVTTVEKLLLFSF